MALCACGCGAKVNFGTSYLNSRAFELRALFDALNVIRDQVPPLQENDDFLETLGALLADSSALHDVSIGVIHKRNLPNRQATMDNEMVALAGLAHVLLFGYMFDERVEPSLARLTPRQQAWLEIRMSQGLTPPS